MDVHFISGSSAVNVILVAAYHQSNNASTIVHRLYNWTRQWSIPTLANRESQTVSISTSGLPLLVQKETTEVSLYGATLLKWPNIFAPTAMIALRVFSQRLPAYPDHTNLTDWVIDWVGTGHDTDLLTQTYQ